MATRKRRTDDDSILTALMLQILISLAQGEKHGYAIMQEIDERTDGSFEVGAGTLYRSVKQLVDASFINEVRGPAGEHKQRRYYRITRAGRSRAEVEVRRLHKMVQWARTADLLDLRRT